MAPRSRSVILLATSAVALAIAALVVLPAEEPAGSEVPGPRISTTSTSWRPRGWPLAAGLPAVPWPVLQLLGGGSGGAPYRTGPSPDSPSIAAPPALGPGDGSLYAVGDSVLEGIAPVLEETLAGWDLRIDALQGRGIAEGLTILEQNEDRVGQVALILLGHNYSGTGEASAWFEQLLEATDRAQRVVVVTVAEWSPAQLEVNQAIWTLSMTHPEVVVADWSSVIKANPGFLRGDGVHLTPTGNVALANLVSVLVGPLPTIDGSAPASPITLELPPTSTPGPTYSFVPPSSTWSDGSSTTTGATGPPTTTAAPTTTELATTSSTSTSTSVALTSSSTSSTSTSLPPPPPPPP